MKKIDKEKFFDNIQNINGDILNYIYLILKNLLNIIYVEKHQNHIDIIIDNIYNCNEYEENKINDIISHIKKYSKYFKLILFGIGKYFNKKFIQ